MRATSSPAARTRAGSWCCAPPACSTSLAERNELLRLAGFAPLYGRRSLEDVDMHAVRHAIARLLDHHDPFPAVAVDAGWDVLQINLSGRRLIAGLSTCPRCWPSGAGVRGPA